MPDSLDDFQKTRAELNDEILNCGHLGMKRFFALDHQAYEPGPLDTKTKELLGLVASTVLRCDDCISYRPGSLWRSRLEPRRSDRRPERCPGRGRFHCHCHSPRFCLPE